MKLSIIIPVYNEEQTISEVIERVWAVDLRAIEKEIIIANDGIERRHARRDRRAAGWISDPRIKTYDSPINLGKGAAVRLGLRFATGDILLVQDADLELDPARVRPAARADPRRPRPTSSTDRASSKPTAAWRCGAARQPVSDAGSPTCCSARG